MQVIVKESSLKGCHQVFVGEHTDIIMSFDDINASEYDHSGIVYLLRDDRHIATLWDATATEVYNYWKELGND